MRRVTGWVFEDNVRELCLYLAAYTHSRWTDADDLALIENLPGTDGENGEFWTHRLTGTPPVTLRLGIDVGSIVVLVIIDADLDDVLWARFDTLVDVL